MGGYDVVVQSVAPPPVVLPLGAEVLWEATASDKFVIVLFEAVYCAFGYIVKLHDLRKCPSLSRPLMMVALTSSPAFITTHY